MQAVYGNKYADVNTVSYWVWQFKQEEVGKARLHDKATSGRPGWDSKTSKMLAKE
jgi:hypothetical protein